MLLFRPKATPESQKAFQLKQAANFARDSAYTTPHHDSDARVFGETYPWAKPVIDALQILKKRELLDFYVSGAMSARITQNGPPVAALMTNIVLTTDPMDIPDHKRLPYGPFTASKGNWRGDRDFGSLHRAFVPTRDQDEAAAVRFVETVVEDLEQHHALEVEKWVALAVAMNEIRGTALPVSIKHQPLVP